MRLSRRARWGIVWGVLGLAFGMACTTPEPLPAQQHDVVLRRSIPPWFTAKPCEPGVAIYGIGLARLAVESPPGITAALVEAEQRALADLFQEVFNAAFALGHELPVDTNAEAFWWRIAHLSPVEAWAALPRTDGAGADIYCLRRVAWRDLLAAFVSRIETPPGAESWDSGLHAVYAAEPVTYEPWITVKGLSLWHQALPGSTDDGVFGMGFGYVDRERLSRSAAERRAPRSEDAIDPTTITSLELAKTQAQYQIESQVLAVIASLFYTLAEDDSAPSSRGLLDRLALALRPGAPPLVLPESMVILVDTTAVRIADDNGEETLTGVLAQVRMDALSAYLLQLAGLSPEAARTPAFLRLLHETIRDRTYRDRPRDGILLAESI